MKKRIALLLAAVMLLSLTACGGAEPAEAVPSAAEPAAQMTEAPTEATEAPTEEPTVAPTEAPRVIPTDFETVDPATLPDPIPVEEQLLSEGTQTVTLDSLAAYEDLLWSLGFKEVRLEGAHKTVAGTDGYCEPVSLTYNDQAFRLDFTYCVKMLDGKTTEEDKWSMYGTKSNCRENVSCVSGEGYIEGPDLNLNIVHLDPGQTMDSINYADAFSGSEKQETEMKTEEMESKVLSYQSVENGALSLYVQTIYYPGTGSLYNYVRNPESVGMEVTGLNGSNYSVMGMSSLVGMYAVTMCFHYVP